ncbi:carotenoid oxygenase [Chlamydoabsidia padenii]|nr:carotenoid oxygenase [Chlamydoabsidia padenii]
MSPPKLHNANILASFQTLTFRNVPEQIDPQWLPVVQGELPSWLNGTMYRVGGGRFVLGDDEHKEGINYTIRHAFDGLPYLYRFEFSAKTNSVRFNSRYLAKDYEKNILARNGKGAIWFGELQKMTTWERLKDFASRFDQIVLRPNPPTPTSISVGITTTPNYPLPSSRGLALVTKSDHNVLQHLDHDTLEPKKVYTYRDYNHHLDGQLAAAHHQYDYNTKETINMTMKVGGGKPTLQVFSINPNGETSILASIQRGLDKNKTPIRHFYYHSFFTTQNYVVVPVYPMYYKNNGIDFLLNGSVLGGLEWEPDTPTFFHIVDRHYGKGHIATIVGPAYFAFHSLNGRDYKEADGTVRFELDCAAYDGKMIYETHAFGDIIRASDYDRYVADNNKKIKLNNGIHYPPAHCNQFGDYRRYYLTWHPTKTALHVSATYDTICTNFDFPRINSAYTFKSYRYAYGCQVQPPTRHCGEQYALVKVDIHNRTVQRFEHEDNHGYLCSEPIFVANPNSNYEDGGVVLSIINVFDNRGSDHDHCYLLVLDAVSFKQVARIFIGNFIAPTFHGSYNDEYSFELGSFN